MVVTRLRQGLISKHKMRTELRVRLNTLREAMRMVQRGEKGQKKRKLKDS